MSEQLNQQSNQGGSGETNENLLHAACYLGIFILIPFFMTQDKPRSAKMQMHLNQGALTFLISIIIAVATGLLVAVLGAILGIVGSMYNLAVFIVAILTLFGKDIDFNLPDNFKLVCKP
ncbi:MAG: hypothetical protein R3Y67_07600 [Eubacteriales bacterium]